VLFGLERFNAYTFGRPVFVQSDHKPLEMIVKRRCQQALSFTVYKHGKNKKKKISENLWIVSEWITVEKNI
jgi:hypothetical protein